LVGFIIYDYFCFGVIVLDDLRVVFFVFGLGGILLDCFDF